MKERPILFSAPMVCAILEGRKTQTRRIAKLPALSGDVVIDPGGTDLLGPGPYLKVYEGARGESQMYPRIRCPYGYPGDRLWVREAWRTAKSLDHLNATEIAEKARAAGYLPWAPLKYDADGRTNNADTLSSFGGEWGRPRRARFMPRWASRTDLVNAAVRVERLHAITEQDAIAEGVTFGELQPMIINGEIGQAIIFSARDAFAYAWAGINGADSWKSNPLVWIVEFKRVEAQARAA